MTDVKVNPSHNAIRISDLASFDLGRPTAVGQTDVVHRSTDRPPLRLLPLHSSDRAPIQAPVQSNSDLFVAVVTALAQNIMDSINRGVNKFMELEERRMSMELEMIERMRKEDLERQQRLRREEMHHEVRLMTLIAGLFQQTAQTGETPANLGSLLKELQASVDHRSGNGGGPMAPLHSESYSDEDSDDDDDSVLGKKMRIDESVKAE
ncbi:hypothetical protein BIW11_12617 [Tropilaelaps mercedesae]|uniref:Uncharacterized protein n=1 Tax=Tropilaelaps mercedesae TaxID=418985 RepID=A0A1V9X5X0_9ACAR|nr:hypothetical protein BIW11_12617 [Tropilaelaps mercedesae]